MRPYVAVPLPNQPEEEILVEVARQDDLEYLRAEVEDLRDEVRRLREQLTAFHGDPHP